MGDLGHSPGAGTGLHTFNQAVLVDGHTSQCREQRLERPLVPATSVQKRLDLFKHGDLRLQLSSRQNSRVSY